MLIDGPKDKKKKKRKKKVREYDWSFLDVSSDKNKVLRIMAFDPGIDKFGIAVVATKGGRIQVEYAGQIATKSSDPLFMRSHHIRKQVRQVYRSQKKIHAVAHELPFAAQKNFKKGNFTGGDDATLKQGISLEAAYSVFTAVRSGFNPALNDIPLRATHIKKVVTGNGKAEKPYVQECAAIITGLDRNTDIKPDGWDAVAIALTGLVKILPHLSEVYAKQILDYLDSQR